MAPRYGDGITDQSQKAWDAEQQYRIEHPGYVHQEALHINVRFRLSELIKLISKEEANVIHQTYYEGKEIENVNEVEQADYLASYVRYHALITKGK